MSECACTHWLICFLLQIKGEDRNEYRRTLFSEFMCSCGVHVLFTVLYKFECQAESLS